MKRIITLLSLLTLLLTPGSNADEPIGTAKLFIGPSSSPVLTGSAALTISPLNRGTDVYSGDYQLKVTPYFFKNETGKLSIAVPEEALRKLTQGIAVDFTGQAVTDGSRKSRPLVAKATPSANDRGSVTFSFTASDRKMVFTSSYHFGGK